MNDSLARDIALVVGLTGVSLLAVILRLVARLKSKVRLEADDYWIITCAFLNFPYMAVQVWGMRIPPYLSIFMDISKSTAGNLKGNQGIHNPELLPLPNIIIYLKVMSSW